MGIVKEIKDAVAGKTKTESVEFATEHEDRAIDDAVIAFRSVVERAHAAGSDLSKLKIKVDMPCPGTNGRIEWSTK